MLNKFLLIVSVVLLWSCAGVMDRKARQTFLDRTEPFTLTVYPVHVIVGDATHADINLQTQLINHINELGYARAVASESDASITMIWGANQAKMYRRNAGQFAEQVKAANVSTSYALLVETLSRGVESNLGGVHYYIVDNQGNVVDGTLSNSHWKEFSSISPRNRQEALQVAYTLMQGLALE